jgi:hypothetical protein
MSTSTPGVPGVVISGRQRLREDVIDARTTKKARTLQDSRISNFKQIITGMELDSNDTQDISLQQIVKSTRSSSQYVGLYQRIDSFCELIGDSTSRIILGVNPPKHAPPIDPKSLIAFAKMMVFEESTVVTNHLGQPLLDIHGEPVLAVGKWLKYSPLSQFKAAVSSLHKKREHTHTWIDKCSACVNAPAHLGCRFHAGFGRKVVENTGNPTTSTYFVQQFQMLSNMVDHVSEVGKSLDPFQLETFGKYFLTKALQPGASLETTVHYIQLWTMYVLCVFAFFRDDDVTSLQVCDLVVYESRMRNGVLDRLCFLVKGKAELTDIQVLVWKNIQSDFLDALSWFSLYLSITNIQNGYIFRKDAFGSDVPMSESVFSAEIKKHLVLCFPDCNWTRQAAHTAKRTSYVFAILGGGEEVAIAQAARDRTMEVARCYFRDVSTIKATMDADNIDYSKLVPKFRAQLIMADGRAVTRQQSHHLNSSQSINQFLSTLKSQFSKRLNL